MVIVNLSLYIDTVEILACMCLNVSIFTNEIDIFQKICVLKVLILMLLQDVESKLLEFQVIIQEMQHHVLKWLYTLYWAFSGSRSIYLIL